MRKEVLTSCQASEELREGEVFCSLGVARVNLQKCTKGPRYLIDSEESWLLRSYWHLDVEPWEAPRHHRASLGRYENRKAYRACHLLHGAAHAVEY